MDFIHTLIADANRCLASSDFSVDKIITPVSTFFSSKIDISQNVNVILTTSLPWLIIPEDGVGGKTYASDFVVVAINPGTTTEDTISEMLVHELGHAIRWSKNPEWSKDLFCELVSEGLAVHVESAFAREQGVETFFLKTILGRTDEENKRLFDKIKPHFDDKSYDYDGIFYGNDERPRWTGYTVGYYIVQKYLEKTSKTIFEIIDISYDELRQVVMGAT